MTTTHSTSRSSSSRGRAAVRHALLLLGLLVVGALVVAIGPTVQAGSIPIGPSPLDTVYRTDGSAGFVLDTVASTVTVIDPVLQVPLATWGLPEPPTTCVDIDWHEGSASVHVGCTNGRIYAVDATTGAVTLLLDNPSASYTSIASENGAPTPIVWAIDAGVPFLDQVPVLGVVAPVAPVMVGTPVEMAENVRVGGAQDEYLMVAGQGTGPLVQAWCFDRSTMAGTAVATWLTRTARPSGIAAGVGTKAYLAANDALSGNGSLLELDLPTMAFLGTPLWSGTAPAYDVASDGGYVGILTQGTGSRAEIFDLGGTTPLHVGNIPLDPLGTAFGGLALHLGDGGTIYDIDLVAAQTGGTVAVLRTSGALDGFNFTVGPGVGIFGPISTYAPEVTLDVPILCSDCPPYPDDARGTVEPSMTGADAPKTPMSPAAVQFASAEEIHAVPILHVPGVGLGLDLALTYRSRRDHDYRYGQGWFLNQDVRIKPEANGDRTYYSGYGRIDTYVSVGGGLYQSPIHYDTTLSTSGSTTITDRFGRVSTFDASGYRTALTDRYGNQIQYTWTSDRLTSIRDTLNRVYTLSYGSDGRLSSVTDFGGRVWTFRYDYLGQLYKVTVPASAQFPSGRSRWFGYSGNHLQPRFRSNLKHVWNAAGQLVQSLRYDTEDRVIRETLGGADFTMS